MISRLHPKLSTYRANASGGVKATEVSAELDQIIAAINGIPSGGSPLVITGTAPALSFVDTDGEDFDIQVDGNNLTINNTTGPITFLTLRGGSNDDIRLHRATRIDPLLRMNTDSNTDALGVSDPVVNIVSGQATFSFNANTTPNPDEPYFAITNGTVTGFGGHINNTDGVVFGAFSNHALALRTNNLNRLQISNAGKITISGQIVGVPKCIHTNGNATGNVGGGLDDLHSFSLPAASLAANGDYLRVRYSGTFATNDNNKRIVISFGGQTVHDTGLFDQDTGSWTYDLVYLRLSDTSVRVSLLIAWYFINRDGDTNLNGNGFLAGLNVTLTGLSDLDVNATTMKIQAEGTSNDDIVQNLSVIEMTQNT